MKVLIISFGLLLLWSCNQNSEAAQQSNETQKGSTAGQLSIDTLRQLYHTYYAALTDTLPRRQIIEKGKLYPVDEAPGDTAFFVFREGLKQTIRQRDVFGLLDVVDKEVKVGFGAESGFADFVTMWELDSKAPDTLPIWPLLAEILDQGGTFNDQGNAFYAPYVHSTWPSEYDPFTHSAITGSGVRTRAAGQLNSGIVKTSSYEIVRYLADGKEEEIGGERHKWIQVEHLDGKQGYIFGKFIRSPIDFRLGFEKKAKGWQIVFLVAGD